MMQDLAASVRARLLNIAKAEQTDFNAVLVRYALERFLYRLGQCERARDTQKRRLCRCTGVGVGRVGPRPLPGAN
ncbi:MAG: hypothetical protein PSV24_15235 [Rhodoferax sp.]|nr:hypothetical protein [Rhodoferax sp.]